VNAEPTPLSPGGTNAVGRILGLLGDEWTLLIIQQALLGATRYSEFIQRLPISNTVLSNRLRALTDNDLLVRMAYQARPVRAEYLITQRGRAFWPVLLSIWEWERRWVPDHVHRLPGMRHTQCGSHFAPTLTCRACGEAVTEKEVAARWGPSGSWPRSVPQASTRRRSSADGKRGQAGLFPETMSVFGNRWAAALLVCAFLGTSRFSDFQTQLGAPPSLLSGRLQTFCANGVLRTSPETGYQLTEKGRAFFPVIIAALQCGQHWFHAPEGPAVALTHLGCGKPFVGQLTCDQCARPLKGAHIGVD
jgi:DNA-binding HxlR family transcriptional regulator